MSGRVSDIAVNPSNPSHWLIGAAQGGIWQTLDSGKTWTALTDNQVSLAMGAIAFAPSDPKTIYAGTGEAVFSGDAYAGAGLLKSIDGGNSWTLLAPQTFARTTFSDIVVHPTNPNVVLSATAHGIAGRGGLFLQNSPARGIFKSANGGVTWSSTLVGVATDIEVHPTNFNNQYAGLGDIFGNPSNGVYRSTNAGDNWTLVTGPWSTMAGGVGRVELAISRSDPNVLYVSIQDSFNGAGTDGGLLGLFRTSNAWAASPTWVQIPTGSTDNGLGNHGFCGWNLAFNSSGAQCWYDHEIIVDPTNSDTLFAGGIDLWKCTNCGLTPSWSEVSKSASNPFAGIHVDQHTMAWSGNRLIVGNDGGVWSSTDGGSTWAVHNTTLSITQFYSGSIHPTNANFAIGGSQDNGTEKWTGSNSWQWVFGGDGADSAISSIDPNNDWAVSFQNLGIIRTTDGGSSFITADSGIDKTNAPFIARFEKCPHNNDVFIAGTDNVWRSNNFFSGASPSWSSNGPELGTEISSLAFAASDTTCATYAVGTSNGDIHLTSNGGVTWANINARNAVPNRWVTDLVFDPNDANILYITLSGFDEGTPRQPGHVFVTNNALSPSPTWSNVSPPVNIPHNTIALDPFDPNLVYVGTDLGVWKSTDAGDNWMHMGPNTGMPNVAVFDLQVNHATNRIIAFTHGRGALALTTTLPTVAISATDGTATEQGTTTGTFTVSRVGTTAAPLAVNYSVSGTATPGSDYQPLSGTVVIAANQTSVNITVIPIDDSAAGESDETVVATLTVNSAYTIGAQRTATVTIVDNVATPPLVAISATDGTATEQGTTTGTFTVSRVGTTAAPLAVNYSVSGTATPGSDYQPLSGTVVIAANQTSVNITVIPIDDSAAGESDETVIATLTVNSAYTIGPQSTATVTITDNLATPPPNISILSGPPDPGRSATATFTFASNTAGSTFACRMDSAAFRACRSPKKYSKLANGQHTFEVVAVDSTGTPGAAASHSWTIDRILPDTAITVKPQILSNNSNADFEFASNEGNNAFQCKLNKTAFVPCSSPHTYNNLPSGKYTFLVAAIDSAGNVDRRPASHKWAVDTTPPNTTIRTRPPLVTTSTTAKFSFAATERGSTFECSLNGGGFASCPTRHVVSVAPGLNTLDVRATDRAGNMGAQASYSWTVQ